MGVNWTDDQKKIIDLRDRNILVAAAAGSGKTAVLVERIVTMITSPERPIDVDHLLVVTFTNAAAAQMRERIGKRLGELMEENPADENLRRQEDLLPHAKIMTIDSFCLYVVRNYFNYLDLDPDFRIGDEGEMKLIREQVLADFMELKYEEGDEAFLDFVDRYSGSKGDQKIQDFIEDLRRFAEAYPDPARQLTLWEEELENENSSIWLSRLLEEVHTIAQDIHVQYDDAITMCMESDGLDFYAPMFESDRMLLSGIEQAESLDGLMKGLAQISAKGAFMRKPSKRKGTWDPAIKDFLSALRDTLKDTLTGLAKAYDLGSAEQILSDIAECKAPMQAFIRLTKEYTEAYNEAKRAKNLVTFADVEHYALKILTKDEGGTLVPTDVAETLKNHFEEIMIDEYQDSNRIQEEILTSISRERDGAPNVFMVGDVKQSIYRFRQARPELFMEKYATYTDTDSKYQKIDLHNNFRSSDEVLSSTNFVFSQIMIPKVGGITYDEAASLVRTRQIPADEQAKEGAMDTEIMFLDTGKDSDAKASEELQDLREKEMEGRIIAAKVKELTDAETGLRIFDPDLKEYRIAGYKDIVVLVRSIKDYGDILVDQLMAAGIPAYAQTRTGYFSAIEVQCVLNLLRVIDNPMQDIPMASVMHSAIGGFTSEELAEIVAAFKNNADAKEQTGLYGALLFAEQAKISEGLKTKTKAFLVMLEDFRQKAVYMPLHTLLRYCMEKTGYEYVLRSMPGGKIRLANIEMLIQKAMDYEKTSFRSLFRFIHYIENIQKYEVDFGEAAAAGEADDTVRINTIHKSKGLEYPIVILAGCGKGFNFMDTRGRILLHPDMGIAADYIDKENRLRADTLPKKVFARQLKLETLGEELRLLYVAMTRAKEKLILVGTDKGLENKWRKWFPLRINKEAPIFYTDVTQVTCYLDWILMSLTRNRCYYKFYETAGMPAPVFHVLYDVPVPTKILPIGEEHLIQEEVKKQAEEGLLQALLKHMREEDCQEEVKEQMNFAYSHKAASDAPRKFSVSRLKKAAIEKLEAENYGLSETLPGDDNTDEIPAGDAAEAEEEITYIEKPKERKVPAFLSEEQALSGADRGTAYHRLLELLPFDTKPEFASLQAVIDQLKEKKLIDETLEQVISRKKILHFMTSPLGKRMADAQSKGTLKKEKPFVMAIPGEQIEEALEGEQILIQGIVDAWFEEDGELVLVDYKTDRVPKTVGEDILKKRYDVQLKLYQDALEKGLGKKVKEIYIYSFALEKEILL